MSAAKLVTIYGGSGFLGRQITRVLASQGWRVRVAVRRPNEAGTVRTYGAPGQVEPVFCNVRDDWSVLACMSDADAVVNCVGVMLPQGKNTFSAVNNEAASRIARLSNDAGIKRIVHVSALGANAKSSSQYAASKGEGELAVLTHRADAIILRPGIIFGSDDQFYNKLGAMTRFGPFLAVPGPNTKVQPVYVMDVAAVAALAAEGKIAPGIYELAGPDVMTMREVARQVLGVVDRRRIVIGLPHWLAGAAGAVLDVGQTLTGGLVRNKMLTRDQARTLRHDNRLSGDAAVKTFEALGISPTGSDAVIPEYLWRFRPRGQYTAITETAKNLRRN